MFIAGYIRKIRRVEVKGVLIIRIAPLCNEVTPVLYYEYELYDCLAIYCHRTTSGNCAIKYPLVRKMATSRYRNYARCIGID